MKLNIYVGAGELTGYTNIDLTQHALDLGNLDKVCGPSECTEIILNGVLNYISHNNLEKVIRHIESRLRHGGKLILLFNGLDSIIRKYNMVELDEIELNEMLYGYGHKSMFSGSYISSILNIDISSIDLDDGKETIIAERK